MNREHLIKLISLHLLKINYQRNDNYKTYSMDELVKVIKLYKINVN
jgi:hypothetical protein